MFFLAARHARKCALDDERGEVFAGVHDLGEDDEEIGEAAVGNPHLLAVEDEAAVGLPRRLRVLAPSASEPEPGSLRQYAPTNSPVRAAEGTSASVPRCRRATSGRIVRLACAPKVAPNEADRAIRSLTIIDVTLSSCRPPYASATSTPSRPSSPQRCSSRARQRPILLLETIELGQDFLLDELLRSCGNQAMFVGQPLRREDAVRRRRLSAAIPRRSGRQAARRCGRHRYILSKMPAAPMPPPTHIVTMPYRATPPQFVEQ